MLCDPVVASPTAPKSSVAGPRCGERARILSGPPLTTRLTATTVPVDASSRRSAGGPKPGETRLRRPCPYSRRRPESIESLASTNRPFGASIEPAVEETKPDSPSSLFSEGSTVSSGRSSVPLWKPAWRRSAVAGSPPLSIMLARHGTVSSARPALSSGTSTMRQLPSTMSQSAEAVPIKKSNGPNRRSRCRRRGVGVLRGGRLCHRADRP